MRNRFFGWSYPPGAANGPVRPVEMATSTIKQSFFRLPAWYPMRGYKGWVCKSCHAKADSKFFWYCRNPECNGQYGEWAEVE